MNGQTDTLRRNHRVAQVMLVLCSASEYDTTQDHRTYPSHRDAVDEGHVRCLQGSWM